MYKLRTVDVWDTLLRRDCHPECIKLATAYRLLLTHSTELLGEYRDLRLLYEARVSIEARLAGLASEAGRDGEYEITHVLREWLAVVLGRSDTTLAYELVEYELLVEKARSYPDADIGALLGSQGDMRTVFLSDFYMGADMLARLLAAKGLCDRVPEGIVSCDVGLNKRSGRLFGHVQALYGVMPHEHLHIGDNQWSDVEAARAAGVTALHFVPAKEHALRQKRELFFPQRTDLFEDLRQASVREMIGLSDTSRAFEIGVELAPIFVGYVLWVAEQTLCRDLLVTYLPEDNASFFAQAHATLLPGRSLAGLSLPKFGGNDGMAELGMGLLDYLQGGADVMTDTLDASFSQADDTIVIANGLALLKLACAVDDLRRGALFAMQHWRPAVEAYVVTGAGCREAALAVLRRLYLHSDGGVELRQGGCGVSAPGAANHVPTVSTILLAPFMRRCRSDVITYGRRLQWSVGHAEIQRLSGLHRWLMSSVMHVAHLLKHLKRGSSRA